MDDLDRMLSGGAKTVKFKAPGDTITGTITDIAVRQALEFGTQQPIVFQSGQNAENIVVTIKAEGLIPEDDNDDLHRSIYVKGWGQQKRAFIDGVRLAGIDKPQRGDRITATYVKDTPSDRGGFPTKTFSYTFERVDGGTIAPEAEVSNARAQAQKLLDMGGMSNDRIAAATGLDVAEVAALAASTPF